MDVLLGMRVYVRVVEAGSFAKASEQLDISTTTTSRIIGDLEEHLGTRLLQRTTRKINLTESGRAYLERCYQIIQDIDEAECAARIETQQLSGLLRLNAPVTFGVNHLSHLLGQFQTQHPDLQLEVQLSDRTIDLIEEGCDLAIRITRQLAPNLIARKLANIQMITCASAAYLAKYGTPKHPNELANHACLIYTNSDQSDVWHYLEDKHPIKVKVKGPFQANNGDLLRQAAIRGEGIIMEPTFSVGNALKNGELTPILLDYPIEGFQLYAVYTSRRHLPAKARALVEYLHQSLGATPPWDQWMWNNAQSS
ncbi:LysR family transcriptional regulator [Leeia sp. TBRC 13508]|uniref:LysR family transcriptional regulator n=1 Tax=Leeia speluncae TaxID=2884804 RepID=A0ABS8D2T9_9NEIS|nr:LysR family transcriptional regulator [Leeia speluncae]MCB6182495.1 LysR family transcriptional regulator [Leeia speluncae]